MTNRAESNQTKQNEKKNIAKNLKLLERKLMLMRISSSHSGGRHSFTLRKQSCLYSY